MALYGIVLLLAAIGYFVLTRVLVARHGNDSVLAAAIGRDGKGRLSVGLYALGVALAFVAPAAACGLYVLVAVIWLIPDRRIEKHMSA